MTIGRSFMFTPLLVLIVALLTACNSHDDTGAVATLTWRPVSSSSPISYTVHYGTQSAGRPGACDYEHSVDVQEPSATISGLAFDTQYYFAVSAFNGSRSACSEEVPHRTPLLAITPESTS